MRRPLVLALVAIVALPLALLAWLGLKLEERERQLLERRLVVLLEARLGDVDAQVQRLLERRSRQLLALTADLDRRPQALRQLVRTTPDVTQLFVQAADGHLRFPPLSGDLSRAELDFLLRTRALLADGGVGRAAPAEQGSPPPDHGLLAWHWDTGLRLLFWRRLADGELVGAELSMARLLADVVTEVAAGEAAAGAGAIVLLDERGRSLAQWGSAPAAGQPLTRAERPLSPPLGAWRLRSEQPAAAPRGWPLGPGLLAGLLAVAAAVGGLALYLYRESTRELREAAERVSFTNQVSHELRTPLTNIRLYAELLEGRLDDEDPVAREHLGVIVGECHRLSRLIGNVLSFARRRRGALELRARPGGLDEVVARVVEQFRPSLERRGVAVAVEPAAPDPFPFDPDAVEQVVANLLSNVEKYAAAGGRVRLSTGQGSGRAWLRVGDRGPGIPADRAEAVFQPFVRLSDRLTEGVSGAGIGLAIARDLARLGGGELRLVAADEGACFELELPLAGPPGATTHA